MKALTLIVSMCTSIYLQAQNPGDQVFAPNHVLTVELTFSQPDFWDSLVNNYATETYMQADITITDYTGSYTYPSIGVRLKGNSSYGYPGNKKSFKIDFNKYTAGQEYDGIRKLNFNNCFKDPTMMREKLMYQLASAAGVHAPRCTYADVYMNGTHWGFYDVAEQIDDEFLDTHFGNSSENLFKAGAAFGMGTAEADLKYYSTDTASYESRYSLESNEDENDWTDLIELTNFINNTTDEEFTSALNSYFNKDELLKSLVLDNLFSNLDSYTNSARNYYIYHDDSTHLWNWIKWDCNEAFGLYSGGGPGAAGLGDLTELAPDYFNSNRPLLQRIVSIAATKSDYDYWYCTLKNTYFTNAYIDPIIDSIYGLIKDFVYADASKMFTNTQFDTNIATDITLAGPGGGTAYGLKSFISDRNSYLTDALNCDQVLSIPSGIDAASVEIFPVPANHDITVHFENKQESASISIMTMQAQLCKLLIGITGSTIQIDVSMLPPGMYIMHITSGYELYTKTFIKN